MAVFPHWRILVGFPIGRCDHLLDKLGILFKNSLHEVGLHFPIFWQCQYVVQTGEVFVNESVIIEGGTVGHAISVMR